jgi:hypothetical protein
MTEAIHGNTLLWLGQVNASLCHLENVPKWFEYVLARLGTEAILLTKMARRKMLACS